MAFKVWLTANAVDDEEAIVDYLARHLQSPQAAGAFLDGLDALIALLCETPDAFPLVREPGLEWRGYRKAPVMNYLVVYKVTGTDVALLRIFHQTQDYARLL